VAQSTLDGTNWFDVAWLQWSGVSGSQLFVLSGGQSGANAFNQTRAKGTAPGNGSVQTCLGGQLRFVAQTGKPASASPSPSPSPGPGVPMTATVTVKLLGLR
jgi:hypothetical protein